MNLADDWKQFLEEELQSNEYQQIIERLKILERQNKSILPAKNHWFRALNETSAKNIKAVILGQDPYPNKEDAMGLAFSVYAGRKIPVSLKRIFKELVDDVNIAFPLYGDLTSWAQQGVLLLNTVLTVTEGESNSHKSIGWQWFTDRIISKVSEEHEHLVFFLWGNQAKKKSALIDPNKHLILQSAHPSPLAGNRFFGNHHFSQCNQYLVKYGRAPIDWQI